MQAPAAIHAASRNTGSGEASTAKTLRKRRFNQFLRNVEAQCAFFVHGMRNRPIFSLFTSIF